MNAPEPMAALARSALSGPDADRQAQPAAERFEWRSPFGLIVVEVIGEHVYVNGEVVEPAAT